MSRLSVSAYIKVVEPVSVLFTFIINDVCNFNVGVGVRCCGETQLGYHRDRLWTARIGHPLQDQSRPKAGNASNIVVMSSTNANLLYYEQKSVTKK